MIKDAAERHFSSQVDRDSFLESTAILERLGQHLKNSKSASTANVSSSQSNYTKGLSVSSQYKLLELARGK